MECLNGIRVPWLSIQPYTPVTASNPEEYGWNLVSTLTPQRRKISMVRGTFCARCLHDVVHHVYEHISALNKRYDYKIVFDVSLYLIAHGEFNIKCYYLTLVNIIIIIIRFVKITMPICLYNSKIVMELNVLTSFFLWRIIYQKLRVNPFLHTVATSLGYKISEVLPAIMQATASDEI